ncbi:MAG TPA: ABC transporter permease [Capillimicrobium sp.]|nr:ABC transporter permease [Capillimicrobium sp.]
MRYAIGDSLLLAWRSLMRIRRAPDLMVAFTVQPIMFVLLFAYVFGGAIETPQDDYVDFLMPGIVVQSIAFGGFVTALGLAEDRTKGIVDRFRSLPMAHGAVLAGRTLADVVTNAIQLAVLMTVGVLIGFSFDAGLPEIVAGFGLMLLFGWAFSWVFAWIGLTAGSPESAQSLGFTVLFPLTFVSSAFVPPDTMPDWLQAFADANPFTTVVDAMRALWIGTPAGDDVWMSVVWAIAIAVVFATLSIRRFRRVVSR